MNKDKKIIILWNNGGRLANQIWSFAYFYAYSLEKDIALENYSFFEYDKYFSFPLNNRLVKVLFFKPFNFFEKSLPSFLRRYNVYVFRGFYRVYVKVIKLFRKKQIFFTKQTITLPPSINSSPDIFKKLEDGKIKSLYVQGWNFSNPVGLKKYHQDVFKFFTPREKYLKPASDYVAGLRKKYDFVVGVYVRHGDYKIWEGGKYYFSFLEVRKILDDYLASRNNINVKKYVFIICSDDKIETEDFDGLPIVNGLNTEIGDLLCLSLADAVIGSNSTYGAWAAYYGNKPFFTFSKDKIDWARPDNASLI